jgi:glucosyl-3-phosphoglycerate phosphatase
MNHLENITKLNNQYFVLRHGQSNANISGIVLSHLEEGKKEEWSLTAVGESQVENSVKKAKVDNLLGSDTIIYSSPFSRCKKSAEIAKKILEVNNDIVFDDRLRERWFGDWEKTDNSAYQKVWDEDKNNPEHKEKNVESALEVQKRTTSLIKDLEEKYKGKKILLVSHGDALQILQTGFQKISAAIHRESKHLKTAEIRKLDIKL